MREADGTVRVATFNLYLGADLAVLFDVAGLGQLAERVAVVRRQLETTRFSERARAIAALFVRERLDVVGLQEVTRWSTRTIGPDGALGPRQVVSDFLPELLAALSAAGTAYDVHAVSHSFEGDLPVEGDQRVGLTGANAVLVRRDGPARVTAEVTGIFEHHHDVRTPVDGLAFPIRRGYGWVDLSLGVTSWRFVSTHTEAYDGTVRNHQRDELLAAIGDPGMPVVVAGDFNATPDQVGVGPPYADAWLAAGGDPAGGYTCGQAADLANEDSLLTERIDYLWVRDATVLECRPFGDRPDDRTGEGALRLWPSDHAGVLARLQF